MAVDTWFVRMQWRSDLIERRSNGTIFKKRVQLHWPSGKPFRILSIDGGGIRGIFPASILTQLEKRYLKGDSIGQYFDLITGTSTGGIIALGLATGLPAAKILELYLSHGRKVFPALGWDLLGIRRALRFFYGLSHHRYSPEPLKQQLTQIFKDRTLGEAVRRLCIPTFDGFTEVNVFKTPHHEDFKRDWREELVTVAMATAAAPTFFPVYKDRGRVFADGGVWANNPVMIGLVDALSCYELPPRQVHILSLGSGDSEIHIERKQIIHGGLWHWKGIISSAMHLQSQNALGQAGLLIGRDQLIRLNAPDMSEHPIEMDDFERSQLELPPIAERLVDENGDVIRERFLTTPAAEYRAVYGPRALDLAR